eukprot:m.185176 g.185176  ORF g.185176 m.185176 type:complete len:285 (+) comp16367_c0_seq1:173-1027(+)
MELVEVASLILFFVLFIPSAMRAKLRSVFPLTFDKPKTVVALPYSPFCEKVWWAFDRCKVEYGTRVVFQGFFPTTLMEYGAGSVPIVIDAHTNTVYKDSKDVLNALAKEGHTWLYPKASPSVREVEAGFDDAFGKSVARIVYHHLFSTAEGGVLLRRVWKVDVTPIERLLCDPLYPACRWAMMAGMNLPDALPECMTTVDAVFERVSALLEDGRKYMCGTPEMTAADITFAALAYPLVLPDEMARVFVSWTDALPDAFRAEVRRRRETKAGQFVLRLYAEERHV